MTRNRRRQIIVNNALQRRIIFATSWAPGLCFAGAALLLSVFCIRLYQEALRADVSLPSLMPMSMIAVAFMLVATVYVLFSALRFSHRIAGSINNVGRTLQRFRKGDINARVVLRRDDHLFELQDEINAFLNWLEQHPPKGYVPTEKNESATYEGSSSADAEDAETRAEDSEGAQVAGTTTRR